MGRAREVSRDGARQVRPAVDALFRTDLDLKRSAGEPRILLERLVVELCAGKRTLRRW
jgi:DNA polymerase III delta subunit